MLKKRTKVVSVTVLSLAFVVVLAGMVAVLSRTVSGGLASFRFNGVSTPVAGGYLDRQLQQSFTVPSTKTFGFSTPLGELTVLPTSGRQIQVDASVQVSGAFGVPPSQAQKQIQFTSTNNQNGRNVTLTYPHGTLHSATITIYVPQGARLQVENSLGKIRVQGGSYQDLSLHANMGAVDVSAAVTDALSIQANMGEISYTGPLAKQNNFVNNMGGITVHDTKVQKVQYNLSTSLGQSTVNVPSANLAASGNQLSDTVPGLGPLAVLTCTNNMGSIHFQGV